MRAEEITITGRVPRKRILDRPHFCASTPTPLALLERAFGASGIGHRDHPTSHDSDVSAKVVEFRGKTVNRRRSKFLPSRCSSILRMRRVPTGRRPAGSRVHRRRPISRASEEGSTTSHLFATLGPRIRRHVDRDDGIVGGGVFRRHSRSRLLRPAPRVTEPQRRVHGRAGQIGRHPASYFVRFGWLGNTCRPFAHHIGGADAER